MKALVFEGKVVDLAEKEFPVHPSMIWMDAPKEAKHGWLLENGRLVAPPEPEPVPEFVDPIREKVDALWDVIANDDDRKLAAIRQRDL
jgi:hypothetical protein